MKHLLTYILTLLVLLGIVVFQGSSLDGIVGNFHIEPKSGLVVGKSPLGRHEELKLIVARLKQWDNRVEGIPLVERMYNDDLSVVIVFGFKHGMFPIEVLDQGTIGVIRGVLEVLRRSQISIQVKNKKELIDCFGVDGEGKVHMVNLNPLSFQAVRKSFDKSIDIALSFIDDGSRY
jgi:hypothetical protein